MKFTETKVDQGTLVAIEGRIDGVTAVDVQKKLVALFDEGRKTVFIDMKDVVYMSSAGMRTLLIVAKRAKELSSEICLFNLSPEIEDILKITGFLLFLKTSKTFESAVADLKKH